MAVVGLADLLLQFDGAGDGVDGAGELDQHAVTHHLDDAALMLRHQGLEDSLAARSFRVRERAGLVLLHEPAVADHIGRENGGEPALDACIGHG